MQNSTVFKTVSCHTKVLSQCQRSPATTNLMFTLGALFQSNLGRWWGMRALPALYGSYAHDSMHVLLITVFDPVICRTPDAPLYIVCHFARWSGNILTVCGKYYMHPSGNLVSFLTVEFHFTKLQPALQQLTFWPTLHHARMLWGNIRDTGSQHRGKWVVAPSGRTSTEVPGYHPWKPSKL